MPQFVNETSSYTCTCNEHLTVIPVNHIFIVSGFRFCSFGCFNFSSDTVDVRFAAVIENA